MYCSVLLKEPCLVCLLEASVLWECAMHFVSWPKGFFTSDRWCFSPAVQTFENPPPPHIRMSMVMSRHLLCLWKEWCVCLIGMLRAICFLGTLKLASVRFSFRDYPWKECPPVLLSPYSSQTLWPWACCQAASCPLQGPMESHLRRWEEERPPAL